MGPGSKLKKVEERKVKRTLRSQFSHFDEAKTLAYFIPLLDNLSKIVWCNLRHDSEFQVFIYR